MANIEAVGRLLCVRGGARESEPYLTIDNERLVAFADNLDAIVPSGIRVIADYGRVRITIEQVREDGQN